MNREKPGGEYVKGYSVALLFLGLFLLFGALQFRLILPGAEGDPASTFTLSLLCLLAASCLTVALLRWARASAALPATAALSFCLLLAFPLGTALAIYWLVRVKPRETLLQDVSERARFNYTVALYILGLLALDTTLVYRFFLVSVGPENQMFELLELGMFIMALAAIAVGVLRSTKSRWAYRVTFIFNVLLLLWLPLGTALACVWFLGVRKHENLSLAVPH